MSEVEIKKVFGRRLREARKACSLTQEQLADTISMSVDMIGRLERGTAQPSFRTLAQLSNALDVEAAFLFGADPAPQSPLTSPQARNLIDRIRTLSADDIARTEKAIDLIVR